MSRTPATAAISHWYTTSEWGYDCRTGAQAYLRERGRELSDRPGKERSVWSWYVIDVNSKVTARGVAQNQQGARRAVRQHIRTLPDKKELDDEHD